ncbi:hypothetical protein [Clostridium beijerinckii]|uniref:Uncharacterized protein n=1 Tax=Clostridium beijerinckii TaxID=1520 RepID=A0A1S9N6Z9_CLOBE|nr:hypothetical protein [Clostridium beijerinckii]OOP73201.1 hypothetical protein CBEIBR21_09195 [Clostridium beijerinckii]
MGKYKEISIEQSNWPNVGRMKLKEPYIDLEKIYIEFENRKISLKEYINKTNNRIYLIKQNTAKTYSIHSEYFIKWCKDNFEPGGKNKLL